MCSDLIFCDVCSDLIFYDMCINFVNDHAVENFLLSFFTERRGGRGRVLVVFHICVNSSLNIDAIKILLSYFFLCDCLSFHPLGINEHAPVKTKIPQCKQNIKPNFAVLSGHLVQNVYVNLFVLIGIKTPFSPCTP